MFHFAERNEAVVGGDLKLSLLPLLHPGSVVFWHQSEGHLGILRPGCTGPVQRNTQSRNKNKNSDNKALRLFLLKNAIGDIFTRYRNENDAV